MGKLTRGLELIAELVAIKGEPVVALKAAQGVLKRAGATSTALDRLAQIVELLSEPSGSEPSGAVGLKLDFGLARGLAYYNGIVFQVKHPDWPDSLGGGGRYDGLARALGSAADVPACGFAYTLEALLSLGNPAVSAASPGQELPYVLPSTLVVTEGIIPTETYF